MSSIDYNSQKERGHPGFTSAQDLEQARLKEAQAEQLRKEAESIKHKK